MLNAIKNMIFVVTLCLAAFVFGAHYGVNAQKAETEQYDQIMDEMKDNIINTTFPLPWE